jgi:hypothetical protein
VGDEYAAGLRQSLETRRDVYPVAEDVVASHDDIARIDADAEFDAPGMDTPRFHSDMPVCTSTAQRSESTTLANSTRNRSPVVLTMRPRALRSLG